MEMPTLFGSEYLLPAIIVVVLLLALLLLMSARRRASGQALPKKEKSKRKKEALVAVPLGQEGCSPSGQDPAAGALRPR
jgi:hypothetical protein